MRKSYTGEFKAKIVLEILREEKSISQIASEYGIHPNQLSRWKNDAVSKLAEILEDSRKKGDDELEQYKKQVQDIYAEIGELTTKLNWLKKNLALNSTRLERMLMLDWNSTELTISAQAELLSLNRTTLYYKPVPVSEEEIKTKHKIDEIYTRWPYYGSRRMCVILNNLGFKISRPTVQRYMREMGISGVCPGPNLSKRNHEHKVYPYLLRGVTAACPNHIWGVDITYIRLKKGWMYLVAFIDWYSRYVVSWELDQTLEMPFVLKALEAAL